MNKKQFEEELKTLGDPPTEVHELVLWMEAKLDLVIRYLKGHKVTPPVGGGEAMQTGEAHSPPLEEMTSYSPPCQ